MSTRMHKELVARERRGERETIAVIVRSFNRLIGLTRSDLALRQQPIKFMRVEIKKESS